MFWADKLLENRKGKEIINDSWTPSGIVHMGSLKGPVIHDVLYKVLKKQGKEVEFMYGFDDADPIDGLPPELVESHSKYLGVPIYIAPSPDGKGSFGDYFSNKMKKLLDELEIEAKLYKTSNFYREGKFNEAIKFVLDHAEEIRKVYEDIYKKEVKKDWYPLQVICPNCGKLGATKITAWDGKEVSFCCEENLVKWAKGCGYCGKISPFDGLGKMPWKVEWAAKWWTFNMTIEGAGKDHASAGGSYDVARKIYRDVFKKEPPLKFAYEHFLSHGKKMSSSKGIGMTGEDLLEVSGPQRTRFLMIKSPPNEAIEFNPYGTDVIPKLFDEYQEYAQHFFEKKQDDYARVFELSQVDSVKMPPKVRFSVLAQWVQMPNMEQKIKEERLEEWAQYARVWVEKYAPESERFTVQKEMPEKAKELSEKQKEYIEKAVEILDGQWQAEELQKELYEIAKNLDLSSGEAFSAVYLSLIGKNHGPKAGALILSLDKDFVKKRFQEVSGLKNDKDPECPEGLIEALNRPEIFTINPKLKEKFPSISVGIAIIKGVRIEKEDKSLEEEKKELLLSLESLTTEELGEYSEIKSYRKLYKEMGVDWHSRRPSPEALLRRIALKKGLYTVNTCVDAYNLVVMKNRVSVGAFDLDKIAFPTVLRFPQEGEEILLLGEHGPTKYKEGEIAYFDKNGGYNIDFNYRDSQRTAVQLDTKNLYINVDGVYDITPDKVEEVLKEACEKIIQYCGGKIELFGVE
ncbi:lysine--tRNA ligase [Candidatus Parcubacteria bacterium]|nr:MAG: lysine--tRNA ligase [Candidatus Parcubacteria bacterium]